MRKDPHDEIKELQEKIARRMAEVEKADAAAKEKGLPSPMAVVLKQLTFEVEVSNGRITRYRKQ